MGDPQRFELFAEHIQRYYSPGIRIADVAGGKTGELNKVLSNKGYVVTTIDPAFRPDSRVTGWSMHYTEELAREFDLVVGLHPDEATEEIIYSATHRPIIVVPCCRHWSNRQIRGGRSLRGAIRRYLAENSISLVEEELPIRGAKLIFRTV